MGLQKETKENEGVGGETTDFTDNTDAVRELRKTRMTRKEDGFTEGNEGVGGETTDFTDITDGEWELRNDADLNETGKSSNAWNFWWGVFPNLGTFYCGSWTSIL